MPPRKMPAECARLEPHESPETDVILLSHSMGGLVAAEIVLLPPHPPPTGQAFRHRLLGVIILTFPSWECTLV